MNHFWKIVREDVYGRSWYLTIVNPGQWSLEPEKGIRFDDVSVIYACRRLVSVGISFRVMQVTSP